MDDYGTLTEGNMMRKEYLRQIKILEDKPLTVGTGDKYLDAKANLKLAEAKIRILEGSK